ncbi:MAG: hypothetical protein ACXW2T_01805 [Allosphingosinicella sp.]
MTKPFEAATIAAFLLLSAAPAFAQGAVAGPANEPRVNQLIIYGSDACPPSTDDEIIVCARKPEGDRFRIPENLRSDPNDPRSESWASRAIELSYVGRTGTESCSTVGPGGFTGCFNQIAREARADRATRDSVNWNRLIEEARRERLGKIDEQAIADEAADPNPSPIPPPNR